MSGDEIRACSDGKLLLQLIQTRDNRYFVELDRRYRRQIQAGACAVLHDRELAGDIVQEALLRVYLNASKLAGEKVNLAAWLYVVTKNLSLKALRRTRREEQFAGAEGELPSRSLRSDDDLDIEDVRRVLSDLTPPQRICLKLLYIKGLTYREISEETGYPEAAVKSHVQNGKRQFQKMWQKLHGVQV